MLSVIIPTRNSERALTQTLAMLVPGAVSGLVSEVLLADGGSQDDTAAVADVAGCNFLALGDSPLAGRLRAAALAARRPWLMFLRPGTILEAPWTGEAARFLEQDAQQARAGVFRNGGQQNALRELIRAAATAFGAVPQPEQGLLIARPLYDAVGGHSEGAGDPERDLLHRLGSRRIVNLASRAYGGL